MYKVLFYLVLVLTVITASNASTGSVLSSLLAPKPAAHAHNPCADVQNGQFVCLDCSTLAFCVQEGGDWFTIKVAPCPTENSMYCNEDTKSCVLQHKCLLPPRGVRFECQNPGKYPDPYDCKVYHSCSTLNEDTRLICPSGSIYSPAKQDCQQSNTDSAKICGEAQFHCNYPGMTNSWPGDANIYYVCHVKHIDGETIYYPLMYRCQAGNIFDGKKCVPATTNPIPPSTKDNTNCAENKLSAHPTNCRAYYRCRNGQLTTEQCPPNTYYNAKGAYCNFGNC